MKLSLVVASILLSAYAMAGNPYPNDPGCTAAYDAAMVNLDIMNQYWAPDVGFLQSTVRRYSDDNIWVYYKVCLYNVNNCIQPSSCSYVEPAVGSPGSPLNSVTNGDKIKEGNQNVNPSCGSIINPSKKVVVETIPIDGSSIYLSYSSEYNPNRSLNKSLISQVDYNNLSIPKRFRITNLETGSESLTNGIFSSPAKLQWPWDGVQGNVSTHPALKYGRFAFNLEEMNSFGLNTDGNNHISLEDCTSGTCIISGSTIDPVTNSETYWSSRYRSEQAINIYNPSVWGMYGWTLSNHHYFNKKSKIVYLGTGEQKTFTNFVTVNISGYGSVDLVSSPFSDEVYLFSQSGQHLETRTKKLNALKYKFTYNATTRKLLSFTDVDNKQTVLSYDVNGVLTKIMAPYGQETLISVNQDTITNIQNSVGQSYAISYDSNKFLSQFSKPNGEVTTFSYNTDGDFISESKNNGQSQSFAEAFVGSLQSLTKTTAIGLKSIFNISQANSMTTTERKDGAGQLISKIESGDSPKTFSGLNTFEYANTSDPFWGTEQKSDPYVARYRDSNFVIDEQILSNDYYYSYASNTDPRSITSGSKSYGIYGSPETSTENLDVAAKTITSIIPQIGTTIYTLNAKERLTKIVPPVGVQTSFSYDAASKLSKIQKASSYTNFTYNTFGFLNSIVTSKGQTTGFLTDSQGKILTTTLPNAETIQYEYSNGGTLIKLPLHQGRRIIFKLALGILSQDT